ncbi:uncharacterized protein LOC116389964 isoform X2 [Anarrhichthys ocellatus]|uniref:uncharacterized protein LOC116389964 isoform X2 n=1 Tax=Anarrhichthys ocellatus TaxID=433405 RepID=UPI0012EE2CF2|nr:uncharacterized protein LOC116389964 isoform X2 [Anarrhichthys ocellatus]
MSERMSERIFPKMKDQVKFLSALAQLKVESEAPVSQRALAAQPMINCQVRFPPTVFTALTNKDAALFDHLSQDTMYPSHIQYEQLFKSVLLNFPFLKESYGSGYQTDAMDAGDDERSTSHHIATMKQACQKMRPNLVIIRQCLQRVQKTLYSTTLSCRGLERIHLLLYSNLGLLVNAAILLLPSVFKGNASQLFAIDKEPLSPTPTIVLSSSDGKPLSDGTDVFVAVDGQKMMVDNEDADGSLSMGVVLALCHLKKTSFGGFLEAFILKLDTRVPVAVQREANALNIS